MAKKTRRTGDEIKKHDDQILNVINGMRGYWPLTLRQIYYQLVSKLIIPNEQSQYQMLSKALTRLREAGAVSWDSMEDKHRRMSKKRAEYDAGGVQNFVNQELENFLDPYFYQRCYVSSQAVHLEIWSEKDALASIIEKVAYPYCLRVITSKGFASTSFTKKFAERAIRAINSGKRPVVVWFGDFDPSGVAMIESLQKKVELHTHGVEYLRYALTPEQIREYNLPSDPNALKDSDSRSKKFIDKYGRISVELDALHPRDLENLAKEAIEDNLDMEVFENEKDLERREKRRIQKIRDEIIESVREKVLFGV